MERYASELPKHQQHAKDAMQDRVPTPVPMITYTIKCPGCPACSSFKTMTEAMEWLERHRQKAIETVADWEEEIPLREEAQRRGLLP